MRSLLSAIGALGALQVLGVYAQSGALDCVPHCAERQRASFVEFSCTNAADSGCLCTKANFWNGVRDCAASCGAAEADAKGYLSSSFCGAVVPADGAPSSVSATDAAPATSTAAAATTAAATEPASSQAPATTAAASSSAQAVTTSEAPSSAAPATTASSAASGTTEAASSATEAGSTGTATATKKATGTSTAPAGATSTSDSSASSDKDEDKDEGKDEGKESGKSGLSSAAEIGIGVGIGAAVLAIGSVALCFFLRARRRKQQERTGPSFEISQPLPGGGRSYSTPSIEKNTYDLEMVSHRYEDMVPRTTPRNMV